MKLTSILCLLLLLGVTAGTVFAAPDGVQDPKPWSYPFNPRATWYEDENVNNACPGQAIACGDVVDDATISPAGDLDWIQFEVAVAGTWLTIGTDVPTMGGNCDTYIELYDVCGGAILAQDDDSGPSFYSLITNYVTLHSGTYMVKVRGYSTSTTGQYKVFVQCNEPVPPPENDTCDGAIVIPSCETGVVAGDLTMARNDYNPYINGYSCTGYSANGKDVTYKVDLTAGDAIYLVYTMTGFDASFYVVSDCADMTSCVAGADQSYDVETISWTCDATGTYYIICDCYGTDTGGAFTLSYEITCPVPTYVCCVGHECYLLESEEECLGMGGAWHPEWTSCTDDPCNIYTPADPNSWGQIKNAYR